MQLYATYNCHFPLYNARSVHRAHTCASLLYTAVITLLRKKTAAERHVRNIGEQLHHANVRAIKTRRGHTSPRLHVVASMNDYSETIIWFHMIYFKFGDRKAFKITTDFEWLLINK